MRFFKLVDPNGDEYIIQAKSGDEAYVEWFGAMVDVGRYEPDEEEHIEGLVEISRLGEISDFVWVL